MSTMSRLIFAAGLCAMAAAPAMAAPSDSNNGLHLGWVNHQDSKRDSGGSWAVPAPVAGVGLPVAIAAAGYLWMMRRRRAPNAKREQ